MAQYGIIRKGLIMQQYKFQQVDVFSSQACFGNPVAVFLDSEGLSSERMQTIARWTNLSETTFVTASEKADYKVRIFDPHSELPFAGHPTLGTAWALKKAGLINGESCLQECAFGLIKISFDDNRVFFELPHYSTQELTRDYDISRAFGARLRSSYLITTGPQWVVAELEDALDINSLTPDLEQLSHLFNDLKCDGVTIYNIDENEKVQVRTFFQAYKAIIEDPVCGSGNAAVAAHIMVTGNTRNIGPSYEAYQGSALERDGRILVTLGDKITIGGVCHTVFEGIAHL